MELNKILEILERRNVFLTGPGGSGKSYTTDKIISNYKLKGKKVVVLGSTGIASANIGGQTLHSFFKIGFSKDVTEYNRFLDTMKPEIRMGVLKKLENTIPFIDLLIIDEISMVGGDLLDLVEYLLDIYGFQGRILLVGDFYQLPPVTKGKEEKKYAFESNAWIHRLDFKSIFLTEIYRTKNEDFIKVLNNIRKGAISSDDVDYLSKMRYNKDLVKQNIPTILVGTNKEARCYNKIKLEDIKASSHLYKWFLSTNNTGHSEQERDWWKQKYNKKIVNFCNSLIAEKELEVKVGCNVIFLTNGERWYNGEKGRIIEIRELLKFKDETDMDYIKGTNNEYVEELLVIEKHNGEIVELHKHKWDFIEYSSGKEVKKNNIASVYQYPIKLSYSMTIHKVQGMTIDNLICDINNIFEKHQFYVSISRAVNPNNTYIHYKREDFDSYIRRISIVDEKVKEFYRGGEK